MGIPSRAPFVGSEALASGVLTQHQLRTRHRLLLPGVYLDANVAPTLEMRTTAAWLWSRRRGVVAGLSASALLGAKWVDDDAAVELICANTHPPAGVRTRNDTLPDDEVCVVNGMPVTSPARTAFDLGRRGSLGAAVAQLDSLLRATGIKPADVELLARRHRGGRGLRRLETVLSLVDPGAESPKETWLRLVLRFADGLPPPQTQIEVVDDDGFLLARLDLGWPDLMVAVEYDGDQHRTDRRQYVRDVRRLEMLERLGWLIVRVIKEDSAADVVRRVRAALNSRLNLRRRD